MTLTTGLPSNGNVTAFIDDAVGSSGTAFYRVTCP
jgi:hypothetical protein